MATVHDGAFELFALLEVEGLGERGREVDVELLLILPLDALEFGRIPHSAMSRHKTRVCLQTLKRI